MMAVVLARIVGELVGALVLVVGGLILVGIGDTRGALKLAVICIIAIWLVRPSPEQRADFAAFQKSRERFPP